MREHKREYVVDIRRADDVDVWIGTSEEIPGLVLEAETIDQLIKRTELAVPELLDINEMDAASSLYYHVQGFRRHL